MTEKDSNSMQQSNFGGTNFQNNVSGGQVNQAETIWDVRDNVIVFIGNNDTESNVQIRQLSALLSAKQVKRSLAANPYKGLAAFDEQDADNYFGRSYEIGVLWKRLKFLNDDVSATRFLPIYGPSGSGKSSLVRAGLVRELNRNRLPQFDGARVAVIKPGESPLHSLASFLAQIVATDEQGFLNKVDEFKRMLQKTGENDFSGFQRILSNLERVDTHPLILVIDQFEEIYSYEPRGDNISDKSKHSKFIAERKVFIENLLYAASAQQQYVSVIVTLRDDFLGEIQQHKALNKRYPSLSRLFSDQGFWVPIMQPEDLEKVIVEPAKQAGYIFEPSMVKLLIEQTYGQLGALPLLQFTLQKIWNGLQKGKAPLETLEKFGGKVSGVLANEAKAIYESIPRNEQTIAKRIFMTLVQIEEGKKRTRKRVSQSELVIREKDADQVESIIKRFTDSSVRFLVVSYDTTQGKTIELAHEALIQNWSHLGSWLTEHQESLRKKK